MAIQVNQLIFILKSTYHQRSTKRTLFLNAFQGIRLKERSLIIIRLKVYPTFLYTLYEKKGLDVFNIAPIIDRRGSVVSKAKKNFPWLPYEKNVACSETSSVVNFENKGKLGVHICYDLWFPESSRAIALAGAEIIINPTLTPTKDRDIEKIIVQATAAQQQLFYIDINSTGDQGCGHSVVCNPDGEIMHESSGEEDFFVVDIDLDHAQESRLNGIYGLGQPIKSFRDHSGFNKMYPNKDEEYLKSLGKLEENKK